MQRDKWVGNGIALVIGLALAFVMLEFFFRLVPTQFMDYRSNIRYVPDDAAGIKLKPNQSTCATSMCYKICPIDTNSVGFRDKEWSKDRYDIAVLGDSSMEAAQIPERQYTTRLLEKILSVDVLNTGVSGYGTIHQLSCYTKYIARYKPAVILLFFQENDVNDNGCETSRMKGVLCADINERQEITLSPLNNSLVEIKEYVRSYCRTCYVVSKLWFTSKVSFHGKAQKSPSLESLQPRIFSNKGWLITEYFLKKLDEEVRKNGGTLLVVPIPSPGWPSSEQLLEICERNKIRVLRIDNTFAEYKTTFNLPKPNFGYRCDPHWNPLAHFMAAHVVSSYLLKENLIRAHDRNDRLVLIEKNLRLSPIEILGKEAYAQIYEGGFYTGESNIIKVLGETNINSNVSQKHIP